MNSANTSDSLQSIARKISPMLTKHRDGISMNADLFKKVKAVYEKRAESGLDDQQLRVVEKIYQDFERNGANLSVDDQEKLKKINEQHGTEFEIRRKFTGRNQQKFQTCG
jgi:peptidyl-dipeptidase Dcp